MGKRIAVKRIVQSISVVLFLAACQLPALSQEPKGSIGSAPNLESGNVYCEIAKPDAQKKYYVFRDSRRLAALEIVRTVGDFGAVARVVPKYATSLIQIGDKIYDSSVLVPPEEIEQTQEAAATLPPLHPLTAMSLQQPTPSPTPLPRSSAPSTSLFAVFGPIPSPSQPLTPAPTPAIASYDLRLVEPAELLEGTYTVTGTTGEWYTVLLRVSYATPSNTLLVAEILPDAEQARTEIQSLSGDARRSKTEQFYKTVHFDTQNAPGFANLAGQGILSFSLKGQMASQPGSEMKTVRITLHSLPDREAKFQMAFPFSVKTESRTP